LDITTILAQHYLICLIVLTFAPLAPLLSFVAAFFFFAADIVYRRHVWYVADANVRATGVFWPQLYKFLLMALFISHATLVGVLFLKRAMLQALVAMTLPILTAFFRWYMRTLYAPLSTYLPIEICCALDAQRLHDGLTPSIDENLYKQPAMREKTKAPLSVTEDDIERCTSHAGRF
jgi:hypothetical protein